MPESLLVESCMRHTCIYAFHQALLHDGWLSNCRYSVSMTDFSTAALAYVSHVLRETRLSATALAKKAGISQTTLTRALNNRRHKFALSVTTLEKIYRASGISPARFLGSEVFHALAKPQPMAAFHEPEDFFSTTIARNLAETAVAGGIAAGGWRDVTVLDSGRFGTVDLRHSRYPTSDCFACFVADDSVNKIAQPGEFLYCIRLDMLNISLRDQSIVIVERWSDDGLKVELTARQIAETNGGWRLTFASTDKKLREVLKIANLDVSRRIRVIGIVTHAFRSIGPR